MARRDTISIAELLAVLEQRLQQLGDTGVRNAVIAHAAALRPSQRQAWLDIFQGSHATTKDDLLARVDACVAEVREAAADDADDRRWSRSRHWDDDDDEPRFADESQTMEDLLVEVGERFVAGDIETAMVAYDRLLQALGESYDSDHSLQLNVESGLCQEARDRLVWCHAHRASTGAIDLDAGVRLMVAAIEEHSLAAGTPRLADLLAVHPTLPPIGALVLRTLLGHLVSPLAAPSGWPQHDALALTLELRAHLDGMDAVVEQARREDQPRRVEIYAWLVERTGSADLVMEALEGCSDSYPLAGLADLGVGLMAAVGRGADAAEVAARAVRAGPTVARLETALDTAELAGNDQQLSARELFAGGQPADAMLALALTMLRGEPVAPLPETLHRLGPAGTAAVQLAATAWCASAGGVTKSTAKVVAAACGHDDPFSVMVALRAERHGPPPTARVALADRLVAALRELPRDPDGLELARAEVDAFAGEVTASKSRRAYATVARLVVLLGEASEASGGLRATGVVAEYDQRYRRFSAMRAELSKAARSR